MRKTVRQNLVAAFPRRVIWAAVYDTETCKAYSLLATVSDLDSPYTAIAQRTNAHVLCIRSVLYGRSHALTFVELPQHIQGFFTSCQSPDTAGKLITKTLFKRGIITADHELTETGRAYKQIGDVLRRYADAEIALWGASGLSEVKWD